MSPAGASVLPSERGASAHCRLTGGWCKFRRQAEKSLIDRTREFVGAPFWFARRRIHRELGDNLDMRAIGGQPMAVPG